MANATTEYASGWSHDTPERACVAPQFGFVSCGIVCAVVLYVHTFHLNVRNRSSVLQWTFCVGRQRSGHRILRQQQAAMLARVEVSTPTLLHRSSLHHTQRPGVPTLPCLPSAALMVLKDVHSSRRVLQLAKHRVSSQVTTWTQT